MIRVWRAGGSLEESTQMDVSRASADQIRRALGDVFSMRPQALFLRRIESHGPPVIYSGRTFLLDSSLRGDFEVDCEFRTLSGWMLHWESFCRVCNSVAIALFTSDIQSNGGPSIETNTKSEKV